MLTPCLQHSRLRNDDAGLRLADAMKIGVYDAMIVASSLLARCDVLYTEDLQHGRIVERRLAIRNPFK